MSELSKYSFEYELSSPITYHHDGREEEGRLLVLRAPSFKQNARRVKLQQSFFQAVKSMQSKTTTTVTHEEDNQSDTSITGSEVLSMLLASDIDMVEFTNEFHKMLCSGKTCMIEDQESMTPAILEKLHYDDLDALLGEYMANFIVASVLRNLSKT